MRKEDLSVLAASIDVGMLADRTLFLFEVKDAGDFSDEDRGLIQRNVQALRTLFLETPEELVMSGNASYLASSQSGWYESLAETAQQGKRSKSETALQDWVRVAVDAGTAIAEGHKVPKKNRDLLVALLDALSAATYVYTERAQGESRFEGAQWSQQLITLG